MGRPIHTIEYDGFTGAEIGYYITIEGAPGIVLQQVGTRVVHVYQRKHVKNAKLLDGAIQCGAEFLATQEPTDTNRICTCTGDHICIHHQAADTVRELIAKVLELKTENERFKAALIKPTIAVDTDQLAKLVIRVPGPMYNRLNEMAYERACSMSLLIREAIDRYFQRSDA